jgi:hypothetical protein
LVQLHWDNIWAYNHLHLKELEILRKAMYYLRYDKSGLKRFCFSGPELFYRKQDSDGAFFKQRILSFTGLTQWFARWIERE